MMMHDESTPQSTPIDALRYIDEAARTILNDIFDANTSEDFPNNLFDKGDITSDAFVLEFNELFLDRIEPATCGAPIDIFPDLTDELIELLGSMLTARIYQLLFAANLTEAEGVRG